MGLCGGNLVEDMLSSHVHYVSAFSPAYIVDRDIDV